MQNKSALYLLTGPDQFFDRLSYSVFMAGLIAAWLSPADIPWKIAFTLFAFLAYLALARHTFRQPSVELQLYPDGSVHRSGNSGERYIGLMRRQSWSCSRYAVICIDTPGRSIRFLISRNRQRAEMYRVMMSWLVLGHPESKEQEMY